MNLKVNPEFLGEASLEMLIKIYANQRALAIYLIDKNSKIEDDVVLDTEDFDSDVSRIVKEQCEYLSRSYGDERYF